MLMTTPLVGRFLQALLSPIWIAVAVVSFEDCQP